jgi:LPXTG-motif cell wall-anchored protein
MDSRLIKSALFTIVCVLLISFKGNAQDSQEEKHIMVSLRMIGHQILLNSNDSTSRVLPIINNDNQYKIEFESEFEFIPEELVATVNRVVQETKLASNYIVEVEHCDTQEVVYSYEVNNLEQSNITPCRGRIQPRCCYNLLFTLIDPKEINDTLLKPIQNASIDLANQPIEARSMNYISFLIGFVLVAGAFFFLWKKRNKTPADPNLIPLGEYHFDKRRTELLIEHQRIELTSKEADLLLLLYEAVNTTVKREEILKMVWGDEGDYVGRTLDVFISKLRKKLGADSSVKIVNIRGVGYKLVTGT